MKPELIYRIPLEYIRGRRTNRQLGDFSWELGANINVTLPNGKLVTLPKGFQTDFSSVPEFLWGILKPFGDFLIAPLVHDWMYRTEYRKEELGTYGARLYADRVMFRISKDTNSAKWHNKLDNYARYFGVRAFGWYTYRYGMGQAKK
jgi:hypothetical protein